MNALCAQYSLEVIRAVMQDQPVTPVPEGVTLEQMYSFARLHNVEAMMYYGLCQLDDVQSDPLWPTWESREALLMAQGVVQLSDRDLLFGVLTEAGIPVLPVKGCWLKELYPSMAYRQMSDLDMLIPEEDAQKAKKIMLSLGYTTEAADDAPNHTGFFKPPYTEVELHVGLLHENNGYYDDVWSRVEKVEGYPCLYRFSPEDEYIYYLLHLNRHLEDAGTGIRSILDSRVYRDVYSDMDRSYLKQELDKWGLWERTVQIETLCDCWFLTGDPVPRELTDFAESILAAGSYGTMENRSRVRLEKLQQKYKNPFIRGIVYWIARICRPVDELSHSYPVLKKLPILLPVFWIIRAVTKFGKHPREIWHHITLVFGKGGEHG